MTENPMVDYSWQFKVNPEQTPWKPGYRFCVRQESKKAGRTNYRMKTRRYYVMFSIDPDGKAVWTGGVKPTAETLASVAVMVESKGNIR